MAQQGVEIYLDVILGLPGDDAAGVATTLDFIQREDLGPYDIFTLQVLAGTATRRQVTEYGLVYQDRPPYYVLATDLSFKGKLALNTGGGQISAGQPGLAGGGLNLVEAVRQMFGEGGARQVKDASNALVTGIGVIPYGRNWTVSAGLILEQAT